MANTPKEPSKNFIDALNEQEAVKKQEQDKVAELQAINKAGIKNVEATNRTTNAVAKGAADIKAGVAITNPDLAKTNDVASAVDAIHKLNLTTFNTNQGLPQLADNLVKLTQAVQALQKDYETKGVAGLSKQLAALVDKLDGVSRVLNNSKVEVDSGLQKTIDNLQQSINAIEFNPSVTVKAPATKVVTTPVDLSAVEEGLKAVVAAVQEQESPETDLSPVTSGLEAVQNAITSLRFPVPNFVLPFKDSTGKDVQIQVDASGNLPTSTSAWSVSSQTALTTTATVSAAAGTFGGGSFINLNATPAYLQFFDTTAAVILGTTVPTFVQPIPSNATASNGAAFVFHISGGISLTNGLKVAATTTPTGLTTVSTGLTGYIMYK